MSRRWGIVGAGAVGGYYGFRLAQAGQPVRYLTRGASLEALRRHGLRVTSEGTLHAVGVEATDDPAELSGCDPVLIAVKNPDLAPALEALRRGMRSDAAAVTLQNGVDAPFQAIQALGQGRVVAGIAFLGAERVAPGQILHTGLGLLTLGEPEGGISERCRELAAELEASRIPTRLSEKIARDLWRKLAWNAAFNGPTALCRCSPLALLMDADSIRLCRTLVEEVAAAAGARGIDLPETLPEEILRLSESLTDLRTSMLQDLEAGRPSEIDALYRRTAAILRAAGAAAPAHEAVAGLLAAAELGFKAAPGPASSGSSPPSPPGTSGNPRRSA